MTDEFRAEFVYRLEGHSATGGADPFFYRTLPNVDNKYVNTKTGKPELPRQDTVQLITVLGSALLSSTLLATAIKAWLMSRRVKISVSVEGKKEKVTFEGPNLKKTIPQIEELINVLRSRAGKEAIRLDAQHIAEPDAALSKLDLDAVSDGAPETKAGKKVTREKSVKKTAAQKKPKTTAAKARPARKQKGK
jgi:hypothetical protein